ncbi:DNA2/NAM7 HELICASE FAMILY [Salix purpurea]|uniref:DNA2/NAM7 HELICASE FAMILY n=1 Tax=Salix purpurea TaxID=77065 RepID=A0A9Q0WGV7_SALPP|nr:DNA2/NAM7 HELICASE FAMILY [Salix purpurea]
MFIASTIQKLIFKIHNQPKINFFRYFYEANTGATTIPIILLLFNSTTATKLSLPSSSSPFAPKSWIPISIPQPGSRKEKLMEGTKSLIQLVFSWSVQDVLNQNLYKDKVRKIPKTFPSVTHYRSSFILPLIEETRDYKEPGDLIYDIEVQPKCIGDLSWSNESYKIALVQRKKRFEHEDYDEIQILSLKPIKEQDMQQHTEGKTRFAVFLTNMKTNVRIWKALSLLGEGNMNIIKQVLLADSSVVGNCANCFIREKHNVDASTLGAYIRSFDLNASQEEAVLSCICARECHHRNSVKLIWGPPGTGKTKTIGALLFAFFKRKCRTLTCAPTNVAVLAVTKRLLNLVIPKLEYQTYGLGDIILFGNGERMKIYNHDDLLDVFLDCRAHILSDCFAPSSGWNYHLRLMICLLEDPGKLYHEYLQEPANRKKDKNFKAQEKGILRYEKLQNNKEKQDDVNSKNSRNQNNNGFWRKLILQTLEESKKAWKEKSCCSKESRLKHSRKVDMVHFSQDHEIEGLTFEEFVNCKFNYCKDQMRMHVVIMHTHLPSSVISPRVVKMMIEFLELLELIDSLFHAADEGLSSAFSQSMDAKQFKLEEAREHCLQILKLLHTLLSCMLRICYGDECQLPAMVQSKISEKAEFGRSLFLRLAQLGHKKHLLNVQYRMHPSISLFPNVEFYGKQILDAPLVKERSYEKCFLQGKMYGSYSFINVDHGHEEADDRHSQKNVVEVAVVCEIVAKLFEESVSMKETLSVGVISPYSAQVSAIQEKLGKTLSRGSGSGFSVSVRSVDGFQGGEEDIILISTVRCDLMGLVGFLKSPQRTNVALTRARYCLWIVGNGVTLANSDSVWERLVIDAKARGFFYNADEDECLAQAIIAALIEVGKTDHFPNAHLVLFKSARWKVSFHNGFSKFVTRIKTMEICKEVISMLKKLLSGWRQSHKGRDPNFTNGASSQLLEQYKINGSLYLVWTVDILEENACIFQVLKVWDLLPLSEISNLAKLVDIFYGKYTGDQINRCKLRHFEGYAIL